MCIRSSFEPRLQNNFDEIGNDPDKSCDLMNKNKKQGAF